MKHGFLALLVACCAAPLRAHRAGAVAPEAMIEAIAAVESGNNPRAVGRRGERGRCQFMPATWRRYTSAPLVRAATDDAFTRAIEQAHLSYLLGYFAARRTPADPALIAAAWRFGEGQALRQVRADSAQRTANLYWENRKT